MEETSIRVVVVDDHPLYRDGLRAMLDATADLRWEGEAASIGEALTVVASTDPDVVLMDLHLTQGDDGIEATRRITAASSAAVLVLTMYEDPGSVVAALAAGARGYLLKGAQRSEIVEAVRAVHRGDAVFGAGIAPAIISQLVTPAAAPAAPEPFPELTAREREVLDLLAAGAATPAIGRALAISEKTVRNHVANILLKLQVADRVQAALRARDAGMGRGA